MRNLAIAEFFVNIGRALLMLCFAKYLFDETGQLWAFSAIFIVEMALALFIPMIAGGAIDSAGARGLVRWTSAISVLICLGCALLVWLIGTSVIILLFTSMTLSAVNPIIKLCVFSLTPELSKIEALEKNNGSLTLAFQAGQLTGMTGAALLLKYAALDIIFLGVGAVYLLSCGFYSLATAKLRQNELSDNGSPRAQPSSLTEMLKACRRFTFPLMLSNMDFAAVALFNLLLATVVFTHFDNNPMWLSGLDASFSIGALLGGFLIARQLRGRDSSILDSVKTQGCFALYLVLALIHDVRFALPLVTLTFGIFLSYSTVYWNTRLQRDFPVEFKGRLGGARNLMSSMYIGVITLTVSSFHEISFEVAVYSCLTITLVSLGAFLIFAVQPSEAQNVTAKKVN